MEFRLVYGKSGSGKTAYIYNKINQIVSSSNNQLDKKIFLIVPEQSNLVAENNLINTLDVNTLMSVEVLTLSRMQSRIEQELNMNQLTHLSKIGKSMIIYDLLAKNKSKLNFLGKTTKNVDNVCQMITELKKHNITVDNLNNLEINNKYQELKFNDIRLLYGKYQDTLRDKMIDENDTISILAEQIKKSKLLDDSYIFVDDFDGFTEQEYSVIEQIIKKVKSFTITANVDDINTLTNMEEDIFYFNKVFALRLLEIAQNQKADITKVYLDKNYRYQNDELRVLENAFSSNAKEVYTKEIQYVKLKMANDTYQELEEIAQTIVELVKNKNYKYNEISIVTDDTSKYSVDCKAVFRQYDIPIFIDEKKSLNQNILIQFVLSMFEVLNRNFSYESMFSYIKLGLLDIEDDTISRLENYCRKWGVRGNKWQKEFCYESVNDIQAQLEKARKRIIEPINNFKTATNGNRTVNQIILALYEFFKENNIEQNINMLLDKIQDNSIIDEYKTSYDLLVGIFDEMILCFDNKTIGFERFKELLTIGLENTELGRLPSTQDQVILGDISRSKNHNIKVVFVVGLNDGTFPRNAREEGFINDSDRAFLRENGFSVAKDSQELLYDEQYQIYKVFSMPQEYLYLSYCSTDSGGNAIRPSLTIKKIKRIFQKIKEESLVLKSDISDVNKLKAYESSLQKYKEFLDGGEIEENWLNLIIYFYKQNPEQFNKIADGYFYSNLAQNLTDKNIKKLYGDKLKLSVSKLERYKTCPFLFHLEYGLKLKEREELVVQMVDTGSFMHEVIDEFFKEVENNHLKIKELTDEQILELGTKVINQKLEMSRFYMLVSNAKYRRLTRKLKKTVLDSIKYIIYSLKVSDFDVYGTEVAFSNTSEIKSQIVELDSGEKIELVGKIDRVDIGKIDDTTYVRIIDYKSSAKKLDDNLIEAGLQLQLLTYVDVMQDQKGFEPAGVLYFGLKDELTRVKDANVTSEQIEEEIRKKYKMNGMLVADLNIIRAMDKTIPDSGGTSQVIPAYVTRNNEISMKFSQAVVRDEFEKLQKTTKTLIKQISSEIVKGKIDIKPYKYEKRTGCDYCKFKSICNFTPANYGNEYNYIKKK